MKRELNLVGGGLAGLALGIGLRKRGIPVTLHEAGSYPRHRVCGEFISGVAQSTLAELGIADVLAAARPLHSTSWFRRDQCLLRRPLPETAWGISRFRLDQILQEKFQTMGGRLLTQSRMAPVERAGWIWSAGRIPAPGAWIGLKCHLEGVELTSDLEMHLGDGGYLGLARIEAQRINVCGLFQLRREVPGKGSEKLPAYLRASSLSGLANRLERGSRLESSFIGTAGFRLGFQPSTLPAIGDAAAIIPPFTGNGMSMAFESAEASLDPLTAYAEDRLPWPAIARRLQELTHRRFGRRMRFALALHPLLLSPIAQRGISAVARTGLLPYNWLFRQLR